MESINDVLIACVKACGGSKQVGAALWPEKAPDAAQRALLDCLNEDRPAKLSPEQVMLVLRLSRARGCHVGVEYITSELGYTVPIPVEPKDEVAELQRQFIEAVRVQSTLAERIERAAGRVTVRAVA
jgi:hypothetical protein